MNMKILALFLIILISTLSATQANLGTPKYMNIHNERGSPADLVFTNMAFYYGDKYVALRDVMDKECGTLTSLILDTCKREDFENYHLQSNIIKKDIVNLQEKVKDAERSKDFSNNKIPIALNNHLEDLSLVVGALIQKTAWLSKISHSMVNTGKNPSELKAGKSPLTLIETSKALLEQYNEFTVLSNKEDALLLDVQLSADYLLSITRD